MSANTPLSAAFQVLFYGLTNTFFRANSEQLNIGDLETPLLQATEIRLRVLAPAAFYQRFDTKASWLKELENRLDEGVQEFSNTCLKGINMKITGFRFDVFPEEFHWDPRRHADEEHRKEVLVAVHRRHQFFD
ncbi:MAG: hypothetical protein JKY95_14465 [Planctomycetaceae bacterium]|nr:hypothetical protein [Planctomycetaceae bacterium]